MTERIIKKVYGKGLWILDLYEGLSYYELGEYERAERELLEYLAFEPKDEVTFFYLGNACFKLGKYREALEAYAHSIKRKKNYREAMLNAGITARLLGDDETASIMATDEELRRGIFEKGALEEDAVRYALQMNGTDFFDVPIFINARDRLTCLRKMVDWLTGADTGKYTSWITTRHIPRY